MDSLSRAIDLLRRAYSATDYETRRLCTEELLAYEESLDGPTAQIVGVNLLRTSSESTVVQAYGAVILTKGLRKGILSASDVPFTDVFRWYVGDPLVVGLLEKDVLDLIVELAVRSPSDMVASLFVEICSGDRSKKIVNAASALVKAITEPTIHTARIPGLSTLQATVVACSVPLLQLALQLLSNVCSADANQTILSRELESTVDGCTTIVKCLAPHVPPDEWSSLGISNCLVRMLNWLPCRRLMVTTNIEVMETILSLQATGLLGDFHRVFSEIVDTAFLLCGDENSYDSLEEILLFLHDSTVAGVWFADGLYDRMLSLFSNVLSIPSIHFASIVLGTILKYKEQLLNSLSVVDFCKAFFFFLQKNQLHPVRGAHAEGARLSLLQLCTESSFESYFGDFRGMASHCLLYLGEKKPEDSNAFIYYLVSQLPDPKGTPDDPRTKAGFVTQQSRTFALWDASAFMVSRLSESFKYSPAYVNQIVGCLVSMSAHDAVLRPSFLDMLTSLWKYGGADEADLIWKPSLDILLSDIEQSPSNPSRDEDIAAARRRVCTLINKSAASAARFRDIILAVMHRIEPLLLQVRGTERSFLYEASSSLSSVLQPELVEQCLRSILNPVIEQAERAAFLFSTQNQFNETMMGLTKESCVTRSSLQEALSILSSSFHSQSNAPYYYEAASRAHRVAAIVFQFLHAMDVSCFPPPFEEVMDLQHQEYLTFLNGNSRRSFIDSSPLGAARTSLTAIRFSLYHLLGSLSSILPMNLILDTCAGLNEALTRFPMHHMKTFLKQALMPFINHSVEAVVPVLTFIALYCQTNPLTHSAPSKLSPEEQEVVQLKQWRALTHVIVMEMIEKQLIATNVWKTVPNSLMVACDVVTIIGRTVLPERSCLFLRRLMELEAIELNPLALLQVQGYAFKCLLSILVTVPSASFPNSARQASYVCCSTFTVNHFNDAKPLFLELGASNENLEELKGLLLVSSNRKNQLHHFKEFITNLHKASTGE